MSFRVGDAGKDLVHALLILTPKPGLIDEVHSLHVFTIYLN